MVSKEDSVPRNSTEYYKNNSVARTKTPEEQVAAEKNTGIDGAILGADRGQKLAGQSEVSKKWPGNNKRTATEQDKYQNLQKNRAGRFGARIEGGNYSEASLSNKDPQQKYNELQGKRIEDAKHNAREKIVGGAEDENKNKLKIPVKKSLSLGNLSSKDAVFAAAAFTAIDLQKDGYHFAVIIFSLIADGITIIPIVGSFLAIPISILIWILYAIGGHLKHRVGRKAVITGVSQACELFGFMGLSFLPFYTISALINYWLALIERKRVLE